MTAKYVSDPVERLPEGVALAKKRGKFTVHLLDLAANHPEQWVRAAECDSPTGANALKGNATRMVKDGALGAGSWEFATVKTETGSDLYAYYTTFEG